MEDIGGERIKLSDFLRSAADRLDPVKTVSLSQLVDLLSLGGVPKKKLSEATYFTCLKILSESVAKLPLKLMKSSGDGIEKARDHPLYDVLKYRPNPYMTSSAFWASVEYNRNHHGNAYCLITGAGSKTNLHILPSESVQVWWDNGKLLSEVPAMWYLYQQNGKRYKFHHEEILHFKTAMSVDGIHGLPVSEILEATLTGGLKSQAMLNRLYENGFTAKAVLQYTGDLSDDNARIFARGIEDFATGKDELIKTMIPLPLGASIQPLNMKLTDAEFLSIKKYTALQIAAAMGIKPNQINDYEKSSYASAEAQQLAFYVDTLLFILKQYEEELSFKLLTPAERAQGLYFNFNVAVILRADLKTQIETLSTAVGNFIYTPNEARALLDMPAKPGGGELLGNGAAIPVGMAGQQYQNAKGKCA